MVPIFAFISPTFIYSFLEEKVQSSNNYLIWVDFPLYAREINTKEISSVVLDCKCHLKIQPIVPVSFTHSMALSKTLWGKKPALLQFPEGKLRLGEAEQCGWRYTSLSFATRTGGFPGAAPGHSLSHTANLLEHKQGTGISACSPTHTGVQIKAKLARVKGYGALH